MLQDKLKSRIRNTASFARLLEAIERPPAPVVRGTVGSFKPLLLLSLFDAQPRQMVYVCAGWEEAEAVKEDLELFVGKKHVGFFPAEDGHRSRWRSHDFASASARQAALEALAEGRPMILVAQAASLLYELPPPQTFLRDTLALEVGQEIDFDELLTRLYDLNFNHEPVVENPGEVTFRGGIIDIYPRSATWPIRVEFWGDQVESMRLFDPATQRSRNEISRVTIYAQQGSDEGRNGRSKPEPHSSLLDYCASDALLILDEPALLRKEITDTATATDELGERLAPDDIDDAWESIEHKFTHWSTVRLHAFGDAPGKESIDFGVRSQESFKGNLKLLKQFAERMHREGLGEHPEPPTIWFLCDRKSQAERMADIFEDEGLDAGHVHVATLGLHRGFVFPEGNLAVLTDHEFFGRSKRFRLRRPTRGLTRRELKTLNVGDYVVHEDFGVGVFRGLEKIAVRGHERECLKLEYKDGDKLFVAIEGMDRVQKYATPEGMTPSLSKLGSPEWERLKLRTKKKIKDIAQDLIRLYAERKAQSGFGHDEDTLWQRELEASFPFEDTPDQVKATVEIKDDMENPRPMDRLVCGDVGFGKTEIAVRAAFKAIASGKQVAMLVPTTVLTHQHFTTFSQRLSNFPVRVEMLSRFRTPAEQKKVVEGLKSGQVDLVIGTHRLLSKDITFKDLGLLIIDEEQRFGVRHKERLKRLRTTVDVLTLTATPIPRTLHMALMGARDITNINTPPKNRLPIVTEVLPFNKPFIREAILRELERGGQVFYVHNRVRSIDRMADMVLKLVPEARVGVAHGQMRGDELERVMIAFLQGEFDVLVSTMIIENGLDMPNVNTIIVNRADKFGLAQLYQLRGRVGRSHQRAYAYLLIPPVETLTEDAFKRLRALEEFTELGSGSQLAMRDLEIRGAGNLLGVEQSGFINSLGFELYNKILDQAVKELQQEQRGEAAAAPEFTTQVDINRDTYLPEDYIPVDAQRVDIYRRLSEAQDLRTLEGIRAEVRDKYGRLPEPVQHLFELVSLRVRGRALGAKRIRMVEGEMIVHLAPELYEQQSEQFKKWLGSIVSNAPEPVEFFHHNQTLGMRVDLRGEGDHLRRATQFLEALVDSGQTLLEPTAH